MFRKKRELENIFNDNADQYWLVITQERIYEYILVSTDFLKKEPAITKDQKAK